MQQNIKELFTYFFFFYDGKSKYLPNHCSVVQYTVFKSNINKSNPSMSKALKFNANLKIDLEQK